MDTYRIEPDPAHWGKNIVQGILKDPGELLHGTYLWFTPDEILSIATTPRSGSPWKGDSVTLARLRKSLIEYGSPLHNAPRMYLLNKPDPALNNNPLERVWRPMKYQGRHRATILKEMGRKMMPVIVTLIPLPNQWIYGTESEEFERLSFMKIEDAVKDPAFPKYILSEDNAVLMPFIVRHRRIRDDTNNEPKLWTPTE